MWREGVRSVVVQDILVVLVLVVLLLIAAVLKGGDLNYAVLARELAITFGKLAVFAGLMLLVGSRVIPAILHYIAHTGSRELFRLAVLAIALGVAAGAAYLFGVSIATAVSSGRLRRWRTGASSMSASWSRPKARRPRIGSRGPRLCSAPPSSVTMSIGR